MIYRNPPGGGGGRNQGFIIDERKYQRNAFRIGSNRNFLGGEEMKISGFVSSPPREHISGFTTPVGYYSKSLTLIFFFGWANGSRIPGGDGFGLEEKGRDGKVNK